MQILEQKIIGGILSGAVKASNVSLDSSDFDDAELGRALHIAKQIEAENRAVDAEILHSRLTEVDLGFYSPKDFRRKAVIVGIVADEDDDGNAASKPPQVKQAAPKNNQPSNKPPMPVRIQNVKTAIIDLGGKIEPQGNDESDQEYFSSLVAQFDRLNK